MMLYLSLGFQVDTLHKRRFVHILQVLSSYKKIFVGTLVHFTIKKLNRLLSQHPSRSEFKSCIQNINTDLDSDINFAYVTKNQIQGGKL
jgi:hypothetical protein